MRLLPERSVFNARHPLARGCLLAYPVHQQSREQVRGIPGVFQNGRAPVSVISAAGVGTRFPTTIERIAFMQADLNTSGAWTIAALVTLPTNGASYLDYECYVGRFLSGPGYQYQYHLIWYGGGIGTAYAGSFSVGRSNAVVPSEYLMSSTFTSGTHLVVGTLDAAENLKLYVDGALNMGGQSQLTSTSFTPVADTFVIGAWGPWSNSNYQYPVKGGSVVDVKLWNRALTAEEVATLWADPFSMYNPTRIRGTASLREAPVMPGRRGAYRLTKGA